MDKTSLKKLTVVQLKDKCKELGIKGFSKFNKDEIIDLILDNLSPDHRATSRVSSIRAPSPKRDSVVIPSPKAVLRASPENLGSFAVLPKEMMNLITSKMNMGTYQQFRSTSKAMQKQLPIQPKDQKEFTKIREKIRKDYGIIPYKLAVQLNIPLSESEKMGKKIVIVPRVILEKLINDEDDNDVMKMYHRLTKEFEITDKDIKLTEMMDFYEDLSNQNLDKDIQIITKKLGKTEITIPRLSPQPSSTSRPVNSAQFKPVEAFQITTSTINSLSNLKDGLIILSRLYFVTNDEDVKSTISLASKRDNVSGLDMVKRYLRKFTGTTLPEDNETLYFSLLPIQVKKSNKRSAYGTLVRESLPSLKVILHQIVGSIGQLKNKQEMIEFIENTLNNVN
jgi:hypothetical protein